MTQQELSARTDQNIALTIGQLTQQKVEAQTASEMLNAELITAVGERGLVQRELNSLVGALAVEWLNGG